MLNLMLDYGNWLRYLGIIGNQRQPIKFNHVFGLDLVENGNIAYMK